MNRVILFLILISIGLSAKANYTVQTQTFQPFYPTRAVGYGVQPYAPQYNQAYYQNPYQIQPQQQYVNPYTYQQQCVNPYIYQRQYGNVLPYQSTNPLALDGSTANGTQGVMKNIGQSILYSMLRGY